MMVRWMIGLVAALTFAAPAMALTTGECRPAPQVRAELAAENMQPIIVGDRTGYGYPTALIFFANLEGSRGYLIRSDKPFGQQGETACVESVYREVRLNDVAKPGIPSWAKVPVNAAAADAVCARGGLGYQDDCRRHDKSLSNMESHGSHVMLVARGTAINPRDHSIRSDQLIVLNVDPLRKGGLLNAVTTEGADYMLAAYTNASYTEQGSAMLDRAVPR